MNENKEFGEAVEAIYTLDRSLIKTRRVLVLVSALALSASTLCLVQYSAEKTLSEQLPEKPIAILSLPADPAPGKTIGQLSKEQKERDCAKLAVKPSICGT